jgi:ABC-type branched-subunit amino acid transport system substrate-binding protein
MGNMGADMINGVKQARLLGLKTPFMSHMFVDPYLMNELKEDGAGLIYSHNCSTRVKTPEFQDFIRRFHEKHKNDKDFYLWWPIPECTKAVFGIKMLLGALEKAGSPDPEIFIKTFEGFHWKSPYRTDWYIRPCDHNVILPMYGGMTEGGWNPFYNGSIRPDVKFPWEGKNVQEFPAELVAIPANIPSQPSYNPRCK